MIVIFQDPIKRFVSLLRDQLFYYLIYGKAIVRVLHQAFFEFLVNVICVEHNVCVEGLKLLDCTIEHVSLANETDVTFSFQLLVDSFCSFVSKEDLGVFFVDDKNTFLQIVEQSLIAFSRQFRLNE